MTLRATAVLALCVLAADSAAGQSDTYGRIDFSTAQVYEDNLFTAARGRGPESDLITRVGSELEAGYLSPMLTLVGRYATDAERYRRHADLNRMAARQDGGLELRYVPVRRLTLDARASYVQTHTPLELNLVSQLASGRVRAERITTRSGAVYEWNSVTRITLDHEFVAQAAGEMPDTLIHAPHAGLERRQNRRTSYRVDYRARHLNFEAVRERSHLVTIGWLYDVTRTTRLEVDAGPRLTYGVVGPEISALLRQRARRGQIAVGYLQTQTTPVGEIGIVDLKSVMLTLDYAPTRYLAVTAAPAVMRSARHGRSASVRTLDLRADVQLSRHWAIVVSGRVGRQDGALVGVNEVIPYRTLSTTLRVGFPGRPRV